MSILSVEISICNKTRVKRWLIFVVVCMVRIIVWWRYRVRSNSETYSNLAHYSTRIENELLLQWLCGCCDSPESGSSLSQFRDLSSILSRWTKTAWENTVVTMNLICHWIFARDFNLKYYTPVVWQLLHSWLSHSRIDHHALYTEIQEAAHTTKCRHFNHYQAT